MNTNTGKTLTLISGPNGAGKTTFARIVYPELIKKGFFLNADNFAEELNSDNVSKVAISSGKKFLKALDHRLENNDPILIETTLSGKSLFRKIRDAKKQGFTLRLIFLWVQFLELCDFRVKGRVAAGGHNIPINDIKRRYIRGLENLPEYLKIVDEYEIYQANENPYLICSKNLDSPFRVTDEVLYNQLRLLWGKTA